MFCEKCGNQVKDGDKFCGGCGSEISNNEHHLKSKELENKSWYRFTKVIYTFFYFFLFLILYFVFTESSQTYNYASYGNSSYMYDYGHGLWITILTYFFGAVFLKLVKVSFFYVFTGCKIDWVKESKKIFNPFY